jgi:hypothetical protein
MHKELAPCMYGIIPLPVLRLIDGVIIVDAGLLLDDLSLGAGVGHASN